MVIDEYKSGTRESARLYPRAVFLVSAYAKPVSRARWLLQPVSGSLNNACDIRAGQTKCTLARIYMYVYIPVREAYVYMCNMYMRFGESAGGTARLLG